MWPPLPDAPTSVAPSRLSADVVVVGAGVGGCAAALAAAEDGATVVLAEPAAWIGGQFTSQLTPPDEHGWIERFGCTASYRRYRDAVRAWYRVNAPLTDRARRDPRLNPGRGWVSPLCHDPRVGVLVLHDLLAPHVANGRIVLLQRHRLAAAVLRDAHRLQSVVFDDLVDGGTVEVDAAWFLDASELGDLIALSGAESVTGAEAVHETGEPSARREPAPAGAQAFSVCCVLDHHEGQDHTIDPPVDYAAWRSFVPALTPAWPGPLLSWHAPHPRTMETVRYAFNPNREGTVAFEGLWSYRRILDRHQFLPGTCTSDLCVVNWVQLDYTGADLVTAAPEARPAIDAAARAQTRALVYWLQTEAPRPDGGTGWPGLRLRGDVTGTPDGLAMAPYIRESRRLRALTTIVEQHVSAACRPGADRGASYPDVVGIGSYRIDLHPSVAGDNYIDVEALPFHIPLGSLVPVRLENLVAAAKNIGTTHITNGCYRLHPVEWNIGEVAGALAAFCQRRGTLPAQVAAGGARLAEFQQRLVARGVELAWPASLDLAEGDPHAHAK